MNNTNCTSKETIVMNPVWFVCAAAQRISLFVLSDPEPLAAKSAPIANTKGFSPTQGRNRRMCARKIFNS